MGVHGLATFLRENKRLLSKTFQSDLHSTQSAATPVVVDGWSFIHKLYQDSNLPWVYGGEYPEFSALVARTVQAWIDIGFEVYFVFDGPCPEIKFPTIAARRTSQVQHSLLFFRTSASSRNTGRFLNETRIIPPLVSVGCIRSLQAKAQTSKALQVHFADQEGDPFAVELAGRIGGYVIGNDSDFVILNSEGYKGYIPLDDMVWLLPESLDPGENNSDGEFHTIRKLRRKHARGAKTDKGIIPPDYNIQNLTLSFCAYSPESLAAHFKIPVTLLPLLAAVVGNDFSSRSGNPRRNAQYLFFEWRLAPSQRIERAASIIHSILSPDPNKRRTKHVIGSVMDLIDRTVNTLLSRWTTTIGSGEIEEITDGIVNATLQYALPKNQGHVGKGSLWPTEVCVLHDPDACPLLPVFSHLCDDDVGTQDENSQSKIKQRGLYLEAYRKGLVSEKTLDIVNTASYWPRFFLENPDMETVGRSIGRPIRIWTYAILADAVGLPEKAVAQEQPSESITDEDDNELVDVVEVDSDVDLLAPLKGDLQRLQHEDVGREAKLERTSFVSKAIGKRASPASFVVMEHLRRGIRIAEEAIDVTPLSDLLATIDIPFHSKETVPLLLRPQTEALTVLLRVVGSDTAAVRSLKREQMTAALTLRWIVHTLHKRAEETGTKERDQERWSKREACCFLATFMWSDEAACSNEDIMIAKFPVMLDRNVQLTAQILASLEGINEFASVLLIPDLVPSVSQHFSGEKFHGLLTGVVPLDDIAVPSRLWDACQEGLEHAFLEEGNNLGKRRKKGNLARPVAAPKSSDSHGLFALLTEGNV